MTRKEAIDKVYGMIGTAEQHEALDFLVPEVRELRESYDKQQEDEKIRKEIISALKFANVGGVYDKHITYLENQKPVDYEAELKKCKDNPLYFFDKYVSIKQKSTRWSYPYGRNETVDMLVSLAECLEMDGNCLFNEHTGKEYGKFLRDLARKQVECKPEEWSDKEQAIVEGACSALKIHGHSKLADKLNSLRFSWKPIGKQKYDENMDKECIKLCNTLNSIPSIDTFESCCGHLKDSYSVWFFCNDIIAISRLGRCVERNYSDGKWELLVDSTDTHPTGVFWLRSKVPFQSYDEMEESVNELCVCIQYWFNTKFDSYFNNNACK